MIARKTFNTKDVASIISKEFDEMRKKDAIKIIECTFSTIRKLVEEKPVMIREFGKFEIIETRQKKARNIFTGDSLIIPARKKLKLSIPKSYGRK